MGKDKLVSPKEISAKFGLTSKQLNHLLSDMGWIKHNENAKGWRCTETGAMRGAQNRNYNGNDYVCWPAAILDDVELASFTQELKGDAPQAAAKNHDEVSFRDKFPATHRTQDGHIVRSKAEMLIDNWLYMAGIVHAYERRIPVTEEIYCDFYLPSGKVYVEFWGLENDVKYLKRKETKKALYAKYNLRLIELNDKDVQTLDDILPVTLAKFGISCADA